MEKFSHNQQELEKLVEWIGERPVRSVRATLHPLHPCFLSPIEPLRPDSLAKGKRGTGGDGRQLLSYQRAANRSNREILLHHTTPRQLEPASLGGGNRQTSLLAVAIVVDDHLELAVGDHLPHRIAARATGPGTRRVRVALPHRLLLKRRMRDHLFAGDDDFEITALKNRVRRQSPNLRSRHIDRTLDLKRSRQIDRTLVLSGGPCQGRCAWKRRIGEQAQQKAGWTKTKPD